MFWAGCRLGGKGHLAATPDSLGPWPVIFFPFAVHTQYMCYYVGIPQYTHTHTSCARASHGELRRETIPPISICRASQPEIQPTQDRRIGSCPETCSTPSAPAPQRGHHEARDSPASMVFGSRGASTHQSPLPTHYLLPPYPPLPHTAGRCGTLTHRRPLSLTSELLHRAHSGS